MAKRKEFNRGTNDGRREESAARDTGKEYWTCTRATADSLAIGRAGMELLENRSLSEYKMGDDGDRLINGRESAVNQGWRIVIPAPGSWNTFKEKKCRIPIKQLAPELAAEEKKLLEQQKKRAGGAQEKTRCGQETDP